VKRSKGEVKAVIKKSTGGKKKLLKK